MILDTLKDADGTFQTSATLMLLISTAISPYCLKLETYLRVSGIPYVLCTTSGFSKKGKMPYITFNGEEISDSQFCIRWLEEKYGVSIDKQVWPAGRSAVEAYRSMLEDGLGKQCVYWRWQKKNQEWLKTCLFGFMPSPLRTILFPIIIRRPQRYLRLMNITSLGDESNLQLADTRLESISTLLGNDHYLMSTPDPTSLDCTAYGFLANILLQNLPNEPRPTALLLKYPNLVRFVRRISERYFPEMAGAVDWVGLEDAAGAEGGNAVREDKGSVGLRYGDVGEEGEDFDEEDLPPID
ncbi:hypothetical protein HDU67_009930 [Dinochytrium kinnereticum]|nr:hypothetical protein HDU67_009930 [Dinochytrium kinnereticum]